MVRGITHVFPAGKAVRPFNPHFLYAGCVCVSVSAWFLREGT